MPETGQTLLHYRVVGKIGQGAMGEVYLADDTILDRKVALKFLPEAFTNDPERMARFEREAKLLASLNHANIAGIYGLEQADENRFLVLEYVEGETLQARLNKGALPFEDALTLCRQIAEGLEAAHEKGVIHRDLKPANLMITADEKVKILDFGLAKALAHEESDLNLSNSPTLGLVATQQGIILGTTGYMSPEQARGKSVDRRADIWAFGVILYEMLTGSRLFKGETVSDTMASVLTREPELNKVPIKVRPLLRRCLERDPQKRLRDIGDAIAWIENAPESPGSASIPPKRGWIAWSVASVFVLAFAFVSYIHFREKPIAPIEPTRFYMNLPDRAHPSGTNAFAISPDGRHLAFVAAGADGVSRIWLRNLSSLEARPLPGTESGFLPMLFWSPDSRFIAFNAGGALKKIDISKLSVQMVCPLSGGAAGGSWNNDDVIIFADFSVSNEILRVSASGGIVSPVTKLNPERRELGHFSPVFLPDGNNFIYYCDSNFPEHAGVYLGSLDAKPEEQDATLLVHTSTIASYVPPSASNTGQLIFLKGQTLMAQPIENNRLQSEAISIAENVGSDWIFGFFSVSSNGVLVYKPPVENQITWIDRNGVELGTAGDPGFYPTFDLSSDAKKLVVSKTMPDGNNNLWIMDLLRDSNTMLTKERARHVDPRWTFDDRQVIFGSFQDGFNVLLKVLPGTSPQQIYQLNSVSCYLDDLSPDGRYLLYHSDSDLWALPLTGDQTPMRVARSLWGVIDQSQFSPNGRWVAYNTNESHRHEVMVVPFPPREEGDKWSVSTEGGIQPTWRGDGRELYFLALDATLMAVDIRDGDAFECGKPKRLFKLELAPSSNTEQYAPHPNGDRFLFVKPFAGSSMRQFTVVLNWTPQ